MIRIQDGQCGLCAHFGAEGANQQQLVTIRVHGEAPAELVEPCSHPTHASMHLQVPAHGGCDGFTPAKVA